MTRASKRRWQVRLLYVGLFVVGFGVWELGLRVLWHNPYAREPADHVLRLPIHHPNTDHIVDRSATYPDSPTSRFRTGPRSYILPSFQYEDPDATVVFLGGSTTAASAVREHLRFPALISEYFAGEGLEVNTLNAARWAGTSHDALNMIVNHVVLDEPDVIVIMNSGTDQALLTGAGSYALRMGDFVGPLDLARWSLQLMSSRSYVAGLLRNNITARTQPARRGFAMLGPDGPEKDVPIEKFEARLRAFVGITRAFGIVPVMVTEPLVRYDDNHQLFNERIRIVGRDTNAQVIDLANHIENETPGWDTPMTVFYDGVHVSEGGSVMYADYLFEHLLPLVREVARKRSEARP